MSIWKKPVSLDALNDLLDKTMGGHLGVRFTELGDDYLAGTMPVDERSQQPMGILHGGASVALAETLGSSAAHFSSKPGHYIVGLDINANHVRPGKPPHVTGTARPLHIGGRTMVWEIRVTDTDDKLVCIARLTTAVLEGEKHTRQETP